MQAELNDKKDRTVFDKCEEDGGDDIIENMTYRRIRSSLMPLQVVMMTETYNMGGKRDCYMLG